MEEKKKQRHITTKRILGIFVVVLVVSLVALGGFSGSVSAAIQTVTLQPGPGLNDGNDDGSADKGLDASAYDSDCYPYYDDWASFGAFLFTTNCNHANGNGYLQFSLDGLPTQNIVSAKIKTYTVVYFGGAGWPWQINPIIAVRTVTQPWNEVGMSWSNQPAVEAPAVASNQVNGRRRQLGKSLH